MKLFSKSLFAIALLSASFLLLPSPTALATDATQVINESDSGSVINLKVGEVVSFSLSEQTPDTTPWSPTLFPSGIVQQAATGTDFDFTQNPPKVKGVTFSFIGFKVGQSVLLFSKNGTMTDENGALSLKDPSHPINHLISFVVNVSDK